MLGKALELEGHFVAVCANLRDGLGAISGQALDLVFLSLELGLDNGLEVLGALHVESSAAQLVVVADRASIGFAVEAMEIWASDLLLKPFETVQLQLIMHRAAERRRLQRQLEALRAAVCDCEADWELSSDNVAMLEAVALARQVALSKAPLLLNGEVGTGRRRLAREIHAWSKRSEWPLSAVLCGGAGDLLEAELFGISGETPGRLALCDGGTLYLDEVGHLLPAVQTRMLRLLRDHEYERVDEMKTRTADVRIIASSSIDLHQAVNAGKFRGDLLMGLEVVEIEIPPLRERIEDIANLAEHYLSMFARQSYSRVAGFTSDALFAMNKYSWPGNIRELRNVMERAVMLCPTERVGLEHLPPNLLNPAPLYAVGDLVPLETIEKSHVLRVVASTRSLRRAASILGVDSSTLCRWMKRYGVRDGQPAA